MEYDIVLTWHWDKHTFKFKTDIVLIRLRKSGKQIII